MSYAADPATRIGHVHLKVSDLERSISFYRDVIGLSVSQRYGDQAAFLAAGDYHHHLGLNTWSSRGGPRPAADATGLFHTAFVFPDRPALGRAVKQVLDAGIMLEGAADHGVSQAVYLSDPDGNGIELYWDRDPADWPRDDEGVLRMINDRLDVAALVAEAQ